MFARFFVDRPVFSTVISVVIVIIGLVALLKLPIAQYPEITPPTVSVTATYPGASAKVVADTVAAPIEQEVNGVENMIYMYSRSPHDGDPAVTLAVFQLPGSNALETATAIRQKLEELKERFPRGVEYKIVYDTT